MRVGPEIMHGDDRRMLEPALDVRLEQESRDRGVVALLLTHQLDRDLAVDADVVREANLAHPTAAEHAAELVACFELGLDRSARVGHRTRERCRRR